jgi:hypothetical protein
LGAGISPYSKDIECSVLNVCFFNSMLDVGRSMLNVRLFNWKMAYYVLANTSGAQR